MDFQEDILTTQDTAKLQEIINNAKDDYKYGILFSLKDIFVGNAKEIEYKYSINTFLEARFFDENTELFIFYDGENYRAVKTNKNDWAKEKITKKYIINRNFQEQGYPEIEMKYIQAIEFIDFDEDDGQAYVKATCLHDIIEGDNNGE